MSKFRALFFQFAFGLFALMVASIGVANAVDSEPLSASQQELAQQLTDAKGQVVYIDFWASWCTPCRKSFPWLNEMQTKYQQQGLKIISVNVDADKELADEFLAEVPANFAVVYDPNGNVARSYKVKGMPSSYVLDREGNVVATHVGFRVKKIPEYEQELVELLAK